ncbi:unnamed protein product [Protopolystoma xenopodis]|uniref:Uncharacterized protein n=1 Tax=Protopolystoma xenopodis TaxID=117903 RepID=A0A448WWT3_9PLAT|nr:unnamed protein product [Protopolystoma xenopodis]
MWTNVGPSVAELTEPPDRHPDWHTDRQTGRQGWGSDKAIYRLSSYFWLAFSRFPLRYPCRESCCLHKGLCQPLMVSVLVPVLVVLGGKVRHCRVDCGQRKVFTCCPGHCLKGRRPFDWIPSNGNFGQRIGDTAASLTGLLAGSDAKRPTADDRGTQERRGIDNTSVESFIACVYLSFCLCD